MKSRIATIFTMVLLLAGTGGAIALGTSGSSSSAKGGAASGQYKPGKGCGDKNHTHAKNGQCKKKPKHNCGKHHNQKCKTSNKSKSKHKTTHKSTTKHKSTKKSTTKKSTSKKNGSCTTRKVHGLTVLFCNS